MKNMTEKSEESGPKRPCEKVIPAREHNRLQLDIRWLKAIVKRNENKQHLESRLNSQRFNNQQLKGDEVEKQQHNISLLQSLLAAIIVIIFLFLWLKFKDDNNKGTSSTSNNISSTSQRASHAMHRLSIIPRRKSVIARFTSTWSSVDENLAKSFLTGRQISHKLISEENDIYDINAKLVFLFVKCNERHIIMEDADDRSQLRKRIVEVVESTGGKAVVIYMLHGDSRDLKDGCLYSKKLTCINYHPILRKLSKEDCVISTDKELSKFQIHHLQKLCKEYS
ncbi:uncharacterized protein LOC125683572 isoform X2 [Ostrea edulis]|uniref:uncharacterized protein LOC125683572 isoform X2 n=1 Tax=Ostrea edulis TaxID=37623 RepID=UPI0024AE8DA3|nr:uncharacterized protein LOC125683572 isoform X2 [Ostrea edulis]XP_048780818.2 uncharacterized protein LOC125683572 isoform X2 [Ostrea edulis]XP_048780819.2 uncharacterized protein LOC125683572 isoform X2 [Ostrea edulis]XP_048780820.2 uncharacterized protein LOC125683572 isoform X2 [Ostrea edulis]XP_048780821.2 uncharacterized protein LOC125683572 isoform X2 [Ostrea edulis]XP_055995418.1 uncharacterized protein LOC125683572 isoform X2 [Ostrea edulis]